jgi:hypothetical protein
VFGQVYQTGADSYLLFLIWGLMALPFILTEPKASLIALGVIIAEICMGLYKKQGTFPFNLSNDSIFILMMLFPSLLLLRKNNPRWLEIFLLTVAMSVATYVVFDWAFHSIFTKSKINIILFIAIIFSLFAAWLYRVKIYDIVAFSIVLLALVLDMHFIMIKWFIDAQLFLAALFIGGLLSVCIFAIATMILKSAYKQGSEINE